MAPSNCNATVDLPSKWQPGTPAHGAHAILHGAGRPLGPSFATLSEAPIVNGLVSTDRKRNHVNNSVRNSREAVHEARRETTMTPTDLS